MRDYKAFTHTLKSYDLYITFRIWILRAVVGKGLTPNKSNIHFQILRGLEEFSNPHWTTNRIISFFKNVKIIYIKKNLFTINNTLQK